MNWERLAFIAGAFAHIVNRREFAESRNTYMRTLQAQIFYAKQFPRYYAELALRF